jgi:hypothetical protein
MKPIEQRQYSHASTLHHSALLDLRTRTHQARLVRQNRVFCGLSLELSARTVINSETVLPKAARTAGKMLPGLNLGAASAALPRCAAAISLERRVVSKQ